MVNKIIYTFPVTYKLVDLLGENITGSFHEEELQKTNQENYRVEEVLKNENGQSFVKWKGYSDKFNPWIPSEWLSDS